MKKFRLNRVALALAVLLMVGCGSNGGGNDNTDDDENTDSSKVVTVVPDWLKAAWNMPRWFEMNVERFAIVMTISDAGFSTVYHNAGVECTASGILNMNPDDPYWVTNEYTMIVSASDCVEDWGPASALDSIDRGAIFSDAQSYFIRVSSLFPDYWTYVRAQ